MHYLADKRHGHPHMTGIKVSELASPLKIVKRIRERNQQTDWQAIRERWQAVVDVAQSIEDEARRGVPYVRYHRQAAGIVREINDALDADTIVDLVAALYIVAEFNYSRFRNSDDAFRAELVHVLRRKAKAGRVFHSNPTTRTKVSYRMLAKQTWRMAAGWIEHALGPVGVHIAKIEAHRVDADAQQKQEFRDAPEEHCLMTDETTPYHLGELTRAEVRALPGELKRERTMHKGREADHLWRDFSPCPAKVAPYLAFKTLRNYPKIFNTL